MEIKDKKGAENLVVDHLSRLAQLGDNLPFQNVFPNEQLFSANFVTPWYANIVNYLVTNELPTGLQKGKRDKLRSEARYYVWDNPYLWRQCVDQVIRRCVPKTEFHSILTFCHSYACGGNFGPKRTNRKVLESSFYWPTLFKDAYLFFKSSDNCQRTCNIGYRDQIPQTPILVCKNFDV